MLDRFNAIPILVDHVRSTKDYRTGKPDRAARIVIFGLPLAIAVATVVLRYELSRPEVIAPVAGLLSGVLFGAVGQLISVRARIADSVVLSSSARLKAHFRESISGLLLASIASLSVAVLCAILALTPKPSASSSKQVTYLLNNVHVIGSALTLALVTFTVLMFFKTVRRVYTSYLEAFEGGKYLSRYSNRAEVGGGAGDKASETSLTTANGVSSQT